VLKRLQHTPWARKKMSDAHKGFQHTQATRDKIAAARRGRRHSPETIEKIRAARAAHEERKPKTPEAVIHATWRRNRRRQNNERRAWVKLLHSDLRTARALGRQDLVADIRKSRGKWRDRKLYHPAVSCGVSWKYRQAMRVPFLQRLRTPDMPHPDLVAKSRWTGPGAPARNAFGEPRGIKDRNPWEPHVSS
jgi:hypothetical protein